MQRILIVEDEQKTGRYLQQGLVRKAIRPISLIMAAMVSGPRSKGTI